MNSELSKTISKVLETKFHCMADVSLNEFEVSVKNGKAKVRLDATGELEEEELSKLLTKIMLDK